MQKSKCINIVILAFIIILFAVGTVWYGRRLNYYGEHVLAGSTVETAAICVEPDNTATRAAANYLAYAIERVLGTRPEVVTRKESGPYISILVEEDEKLGTEMFDKTMNGGEKAEIIIAEAASTNGPTEKDSLVYSVALEKEDLIISIPRRKDCFGAIKAFADRWLQKDCGLESTGELRISNRMIREQLSNLPIELDDEIKVLSQNLRYIDDIGGNSVEERAKRFEKLVQEYQPDLIGTQECTFQWLQLLKKMFSEEYEVYGCSRLGPDSDKEEWNAVLYRKDRFTLLDGDTFWLSNTPGTVASKLNYEGTVRICTWVQLQDNMTEKIILFSNTHLQNGETEYFQEVRASQAEILLRQLRKGVNRLANIPGFLTGDFNGEAGEPFYSLITGDYQDTRVAAINNNSTVDYSFHAYGEAKALVDFCFCSPETITVLDYRILDDQYDGYVSDHYGVLATALIN